MLYNLSDFLTKLKEDIGIKDIVLPVNDVEITKRFVNSALKEFSVRYPLIDEVVITSNEAIDLSERSRNGSVTYIIPKQFYDGQDIISILGINPGGYGSESNMYMPNVVLGSADMLLESIADIKMAAALGSMMAHAPTFQFMPPDRIRIYNGWTAGSYRLEIALTHSSSLSTIPAGAFTNLFELSMYDIEEFLYNKLKRITELDVGVGNIQLRIDNWENAAQNKRELLEKWDDSGNLSLDRINFF
jgi:hypothetical protein